MPSSFLARPTAARPQCHAAEGIWRDDENGGALVPDFPILLHCYMTEEHASDKKLQAKVGAFCKRMGKEMRQGEVALILDGVFYSFSNFG